MLRILDANLNRLAEGLRVLEDISRLVLNDATFSQQLKTLRHSLRPLDKSLQEKLLSARRAEDDVGACTQEEGEGQRPDLLSLVRANSQRAEQSLRVIEEITKVPEQDFGFDWQVVKTARFKLYELEQAILLSLVRHEKRQRVSGLYLILDTEAVDGRSATDIARQAIEGGARVVQLRDKKGLRGELLPLAIEVKKVCDQQGALFLVNDHLDIALAADADGLHLGQRDLPVPVARRLLPAGKIVGASAATVDEAVRAQEQGADYIGVGAMYPTSSKQDTRPAGLETLHRVSQNVSVPVVAIGGISEHNAAQVMEAGASAAAVISAVLSATDVREACRRLVAAIEGENR